MSVSAQNVPPSGRSTSSKSYATGFTDLFFKVAYLRGLHGAILNDYDDDDYDK